MDTPTQNAAPARRWWALASVAAAQFLAVVDAFIVNVAIPSIRADLHAGRPRVVAARELDAGHGREPVGEKAALEDGGDAVLGLVLDLERHKSNNILWCKTNI